VSDFAAFPRSFFLLAGVCEQQVRPAATWSDQMNLRGKTRDQIERGLANKSRSELLDLIFSLVTVEQLLKPAEIAARSCLNKRAVLRDIREGKFGPYFCRAENSIAVPASGVNQWRQSFLVPSNNECTHDRK
jgi:hypothetical protein